MSRKSKSRQTTGSTGIKAAASAMDSLRRLLREGAIIYEARRNFILQSDDPEHVHQARVALRRMRSLLRGFDGMLTGESTSAINDLLAKKFRELGPLRDADVHAEAVSGQDGADQARQAAAELRAQLRQAFRDSTDLSLKAQIDAILHDSVKVLRGARRQRLARAPVTIIAARALQLAWTELLAFGGDLDTLSPDGLHQFRKRAKDMRYLVDYFAPLFPDASGKMPKRLSQMQDALGIVNDLAVMREKSGQDEEIRLPADAERTEAKARKAANKAWRKLSSEPAWWCDIPPRPTKGA
ncbi:CHAD domain-containing protein [Paracoccus seriniphilus]|uniref:CHAD domain-containing protein n=2 Tax=Paracoccus seriniphilus TaxID=184748 RepID=A0A239PN16_9RHOB|nr:CHAD domain-containing protein [Paracoccus seriniphilus]SNT71560.1 CHAD domain-containing protein [Paracoccus seriniphilus]